MAVTTRPAVAPKTDTPITTPPAEIAPVAVAPAPKKIRLMLKLCAQYDYMGFLYRKGQLYAFAPDRAEKMLRLTDEYDRPVFARYVEPLPERMLVRGPVVNDMEDAAVVAAASKIQSKTERPKAINTTTPEEEAELMGSLGVGGEDPPGEEIGD